MPKTKNMRIFVLCEVLWILAYAWFSIVCLFAVLCSRLRISHTASPWPCVNLQ